MVNMQNIAVPPKVWVLQTDKMGDTNNRRAIAEAASRDVTLIDLRDDSSIEAYIKQTFGVSDIADFQEWPDIFITCEQASGEIAKDVKELSSGNVFIAGLQAPDIDSNDFDDPALGKYFDMQILFSHLASAYQSSFVDSTAKRYLYDFAPSPITQDKLDHASIPEEITRLHDEYGQVYMLTLGSLIHSREVFGHDSYQNVPHECLIS